MRKLKKKVTIYKFCYRFLITEVTQRNVFWMPANCSILTNLSYLLMPKESFEYVMFHVSRPLINILFLFLELKKSLYAIFSQFGQASLYLNIIDLLTYLFFHLDYGHRGFKDIENERPSLCHFQGNRFSHKCPQRNARLSFL